MGLLRLGFLEVHAASPGSLEMPLSPEASQDPPSPNTENLATVLAGELPHLEGHVRCSAQCRWLSPTF